MTERAVSRTDSKQIVEWSNLPLGKSVLLFGALCSFACTAVLLMGKFCLPVQMQFAVGMGLYLCNLSIAGYAWCSSVSRLSRLTGNVPRVLEKLSQLVFFTPIVFTNTLLCGVAYFLSLIYPLVRGGPAGWILPTLILAIIFVLIGLAVGFIFPWSICRKLSARVLTVEKNERERQKYSFVVATVMACGLCIPTVWVVFNWSYNDLSAIPAFIAFQTLGYGVTLFSMMKLQSGLAHATSITASTNEARLAPPAESEKE